MNKEQEKFCDIETGFCEVDGGGAKESPLNEEEAKGGKVKLTYFYDALCGWCYGFSHVITALQETYKDQIEIDVVSGGLFSGDRVGLINDIAGYIKQGAYKNVEERTGVKFGKAFLDKVYGDGNIYLNSLNPAIALSIVKEELPGQKLFFAKTLLDATYSDGLSTDDVEGYATYAEKIGLDKQEFIAKMKMEKYINAAQKDYEHFRLSGLGGMPSLVLHQENQNLILVKGYADFEALKTQVEQFL